MNIETIWYRMVQNGTDWYGLVRIGTDWYGMVRNGKEQKVEYWQT